MSLAAAEREQRARRGARGRARGGRDPARLPRHLDPHAHRLQERRARPRDRGRPGQRARARASACARPSRAHAIEAEEAVRDAASAGPRWFLDPLDGTVNFVHGCRPSRSRSGCGATASPEVAVVHAPRLGETFHAVRAAARSCGAGAARRTRLSVWRERSRRAPPASRTGARTRARQPRRLQRPVPGRARPARMGSAALDLAYVAAGASTATGSCDLAPHDVGRRRAARARGRRAGDATSTGGEDWLRGGHVAGRRPAALPREPRGRRLAALRKSRRRAPARGLPSGRGVGIP
jgi:myo-inositol-1(or 4)-monophosphatase